MIARIWRGRTPASKSEAYLELMRTVAIPDYRETPGNRGAWCLHRPDGELVEVTMLSMWEGLKAIEAFAGTPVDAAKYYDFDKDYLVDFPERVEHHEVFGGELGSP